MWLKMQASCGFLDLVNFGRRNLLHDPNWLVCFQTLMVTYYNISNTRKIEWCLPNVYSYLVHPKCLCFGTSCTMQKIITICLDYVEQSSCEMWWFLEQIVQLHETLGSARSVSMSCSAENVIVPFWLASSKVLGSMGSFPPNLS